MRVGIRTRNCIAALDATTGAATPWNPQSDNILFALAASGNVVYAGGAFSNMGVTVTRNVAEFEP
jgi:trimeric autotransporter adhesin